MNISVYIVENMYQKLMEMLIILRGHNGGLGIEENVVTLCSKCHYEEDFGQNTKEYEEYIENYLKGIYGEEWNKENLIYKKY